MDYVIFYQSTGPDPKIDLIGIKAKDMLDALSFFLGNIESGKYEPIRISKI